MSKKLFLSIIFLPYIACALNSKWIDNDQIKLRLIVKQVAKDHVNMAVEFKMRDGWHIFYKDPGDSGIGTQFISKDKLQVFWPKPKKEHYTISHKHLTSNIYDKHVIIPLKLSKPFSKIHIEVRYAACGKNACIPKRAVLEQELSKK